MARPFDLGGAITSTTNPKVKRLVRLAERRDRDEEGMFLVEGTRAIERFLATGRPLLELYVAPDWFDEAADLCWSLIALAQGVGTSIQALSRDAFAKCAYRERPEGLIGVARQWVDDLSDLVLSSQPLILIAVGIEKPGNLGSLLRSADAAGCEAVILCDSRVDRFNPNVIRSSTGVVFSIPIVTAARTATVEFLKRSGIVSVATTPEAETSLYDVDLTRPVAVLVGAEDVGLSAPWLSDSDMQVRLPMLGQADSLNVAMATVVTLYEVVRQRTAMGKPETSVQA